MATYSHAFNFEGGVDLATMGATWFVSYSYYRHIDTSQTRWKKVKTYPSRSAVWSRTVHYHVYWLQQVIYMEDARLNTNSLGISARETKMMALKLLEKLQ